MKSNIWDSDPDSHLIIRNEMIKVADPEYKTASTRELVIAPDAKIEFREAWIQRGKKIIRLDDEVWKIIPGDDEKATTVIIAFTDVEKGDILGWSLEQNCDWFYGGGYIAMADDLPVMLCRTRLKTDGSVAYKTTGEHLRRDKWGRKILEKKHGTPCDIRFTVVDIPRHPTGRYAPNFLEFEPYLNVVYRGFWSKRTERWMFNVSWNEVAIRGSSILKYYNEKSGALISDARKVALGYTTPRKKADALHRFIRDEFVEVSPFMVRSRKSDLKSVFDSRQATARQKSILMFAMCRALGLDVDVLVGRNQLLSRIDKANPYLGQMTEYVVRLNDNPVAYFTPANNNSAPGELPPELRGTEMLEFTWGIEERVGEVRDKAFENTGAQPTLYWDEYCRLIKAEKLAKWVVLPGDPDEVMATTAEVVCFFPAKEEVSVQVLARGYSDLQFRLGNGGSDENVLGSYMKMRFGETEVNSASCSMAPTRGELSRMDGNASVAAVPDPAGDTWIIPAENVFGNVFLYDWDVDEGTPFIDRVVEDFQYTWRTALPEGWEGADLPEEFTAVHPQFSYLCRFKVEDGNLVVQREIRMKRKLTMYSDLKAFGDEVLRVQGFERGPVVLVRK